MSSAQGTPAKARQTPAMRQYARFKEQHPDCVLFFRMGDFYEMFDEDAVLAHKVLGLTLTQRTEGIPMAGIPYHALDNYLRRMIEQGHRVAICDQVQDASEAKGIVERAVTRVLTPGTLVDDGLLDESVPNLVAAVHGADDAAGGDLVVAAVELSTGSFTIRDVPAGRLVDELARIGPRELLYAETTDGKPPAVIAAVETAMECSLTPRSDWTFRLADAFELLTTQFRVAHLEGFGLVRDDPAIAAAGALLRYLQETQAPDADPGGRRLGHLQPPRRESTGETVIIDAASLRSLEIERTMRSGQVEGSLLWVLQRCRTPMGKRLLRQWLCFPSCRRDVIEARQRCVQHLVDERDLAEALTAPLGRVQDVARIVGRTCMGRATPRDVVALGASVALIDTLAEVLDGRPSFGTLHEELVGLSGALVPLAQSIGERCVDEAPAHLREGGLFRDGVDPELDEARTLGRDAGQWLAAYQKRLVEETGIPSLKVGFNKVFGYYIEVTHAHVAKIPDVFTRKQTLKNAERYITAELKTFEEKALTAESRAVAREKALFESLCAEIATASRELFSLADILARLDVLTGFADTAFRQGFVRPQLVDDPILDIRQARHPVLDKYLRDRFVPNDCMLGAQHASDPNAQDSRLETQDSLALITGPNMAGKSTYIRQVALIVLMAHTGSFVPAEAATIGLTDRIFTRIGASDELHSGQSTFMVEMTETANILHHATVRSLVILDEIGRGTSTLDGLSLAWAIAETIAARRCRTLFATHYHELTGLADRLDNVTNLHVSVREWGEEVIFLYRILPGRTDRSYGIHVARIAGLPDATVRRASELLETLAVQTEPAALVAPPPPPPTGQLGLFTEYLPHPVIQELKSLDLESINPIQAFDRLRHLVREVSGEAGS